MPPELVDRLRLLAAHTALGHVLVDEIVSFANELLDLQIYDYELLAIVDSRPASHSENIPRLRRYCSKLGIHILSADDALTAFLTHRVNRMLATPSLALDELKMLAAETQPDGMQRLRELYSNCETAINDLCFVETLQNWYTQSPQNNLRPEESMSLDLSGLQRQVEQAAARICESISVP